MAAPLLAAFAFLYLRKILPKDLPGLVEKNPLFRPLQGLWPYLLSLPACLYLYFFSISAYTGFFLQDQDFTNISSALNHAAHFQGLLRTGFLETGPKGSYLGHHFAPLLLGYVPFYILAERFPFLVQPLQPISVELPTHFLYAGLLWLTFLLGLLLWIQTLRSVLKNVFLQNTAWALLLMQPILWRLIASFHFEILVLPASGLLFWGLHKKRLFGFAIGAASMLLIKEDISIYLSFFGIYLFLHKGYGRSHLWGAWLFAACILYFLALKGILIPYFSSGEAVAWEGYWTKEAPVPIPSLWKPSWSILLASGFLILLNIRYFFLVLVPILLLHAFSRHLFHQGFLGHYSYTILPFLFYGILLGGRRLFAIAMRLDKSRLPAFAFAVAIFFCAQANASDRLTPAFLLPRKAHANKIEKQLQVLAASHPDSCVQASPVLTPHLALSLRALPLNIPCSNFYSPLNHRCKRKQNFLQRKSEIEKVCPKIIQITQDENAELQITQIL